jgi:hypothetical protein
MITKTDKKRMVNKSLAKLSPELAEEGPKLKGPDPGSTLCA